MHISDQGTNNGSSTSTHTALTRPDGEGVDTACDRFETEWRAGHWPCIEGYLDAVDGAERPGLFDELLELEIELRLEKGESPTAREYHLRFPDHAEAIDAIFSQERREGSLRSTNSLNLHEPIPSAAEAATSAASTVGMGPGAISELPEVDGSLGRIVGEYTILDRIGSGGMGVVYRALQRGANRIVALKLIKADWWGDSTDDGHQAAAHRFRREVENHARLEHDHIVRVYDAGHADGLLFFAMQLIRGRSLAQIARNEGFLPGRRAACYLEAVARAIQYAHDHGVLHCDVKPGNIMIGEGDRPYLIDLGLAKSLEVTDYVTLSGKAIGTPEYMSPEQARGNGKVGFATDVYGLGATLFALLTGQPPFTGPNHHAILRKVIDEEPVWPRKLSNPVDRELKAICLKCLEKEPARRFSSAGELAVVLEKYLQYEHTGVTLPAPWTRVYKWAKRKPWRAVAAGLGFFAVVVVIAALALRAHHNRVMAESLLHDVQTLPLADLAPTITRLKSYRDSVAPGLHQMLEGAPPGSELRRRALLALLPFEPMRASAVVDELLTSTPEQHRVLREALRGRWADLAPGLRAVLATTGATAAARSRAAAALIALDTPNAPAGRAEYSELQLAPDPSRRTALVDWLVQSKVDAGVLANRLEIEPDASVERQLLQALGALGDGKPPAGITAPFLSRLKTLYRDHPDPGIHSSLAYLLRRWGMGSDVKLIDAALAGKPPGGRGWYVNSAGMTMVIVVPGNELPPSLGLSELPNRFAIAATETPLALFQEFDPSHDIRRREEHAEPANTGTDLPADVVSYFDAARFCNWLSEREHLPPDEWCYRAGRASGAMILVDDYRSRRGYRLPTSAEWEYAARAGTVTDRYFGQDTSHLRDYAWYLENSGLRPNAIGLLRPNDFGLFDVIGNVSEWCYKPDLGPDVNCSHCQAGQSPEQSELRCQSLRGDRFAGGPRGQSVRNVREFFNHIHPTNRLVYSGFRVVKNEP
jgi:serine/threonine protein kinase/formylglycine-generating enzyme required for sulfatase activity